MKYFFVLLTFTFLFSSCKKNFTSVSQEKTLEQFDSLVLQSVFEVHLIEGTTNAVRIDGAKKIVEDIECNVTNNTLTITNKYKGNWMHPRKNKIKIYITTDGLNLITANETCDIYADTPLTGNEIGLVLKSKLNMAHLDLACNTFYFWNNFPCGGKVKLQGNVNMLKLWNVALMEVDASNLAATDAFVENSSKADCILKCQQNLSYSIKGEGNIRVKGTPGTITNFGETSIGKLIIE